MSKVKLKEGKNYNPFYLVFSCWSNGEADYGGISYLEYFKNEVYLGPDENGVEPLFEEMTTADIIEYQSLSPISKALVREMEESYNCGQYEGVIMVGEKKCFVE